MAVKTICAECVEIHKSMMENAHKAGLLRAAEIAEKYYCFKPDGKLLREVAEAIRKEANGH